jgi:hypothetical protein
VPLLYPIHAFLLIQAVVSYAKSTKTYNNRWNKTVVANYEAGSRFPAAGDLEDTQAIAFVKVWHLAPGCWCRVPLPQYFRTVLCTFASVLLPQYLRTVLCMEDQHLSMALVTLQKYTLRSLPKLANGVWCISGYFMVSTDGQYFARETST